jgi:hypothetical protein
MKKESNRKERDQRKSRPSRGKAHKENSDYRYLC